MINYFFTLIWNSPLIELHNFTEKKSYTNLTYRTISINVNNTLYNGIQNQQLAIYNIANEDSKST